MSLEIKINGSRVNIPDKQTIAYNLINFDLKDMGNRKFNYTNSFQIPREGNELIFGFASHPSSNQNTPYSALVINITVDGLPIVVNGSGFIESFSDGFYNIQVTESKDLISEMKETPLSTLYSGDTIPINSGSDLNNLLRLNTTGFRMPIIMDDENIQDAASADSYTFLNDEEVLIVYVKSVFAKYATVNSVTFAGDLYSDTYFSNLLLNVFNVDQTGLTEFININIHPTKSFHDLFKEILKIFGATFKISGSTITINKLDNFSYTSYIDWSGKVTKVNKKLFAIPGTGQNNYMRYKESDGASKTLNQSLFTCNNVNIAVDADIFKFDAKVYPLILMDAYSNYVDQATIYWKENKRKVDSAGVITRPVNDFVFMYYGSLKMWEGFFISASGQNYTTADPDTYPLYLPVYYNSTNEYLNIKKMLTDPVVYEVDMWLNLLDIVNFTPFKFVFIKELGGLFYVNTIKDYLLNSDDKTANVELIKINPNA